MKIKVSLLQCQAEMLIQEIFSFLPQATQK